MEGHELYLEDVRKKTFKYWPFTDKDKCNALHMAQAGFYSTATRPDDADSAKCFLCGKELDGWEADDDPWAEHMSHASHCAFAQLGKKEDELLTLDFLSIVKQYMLNQSKRKCEEAKAEIDSWVLARKRTAMKRHSQLVKC